MKSRWARRGLRAAVGAAALAALAVLLLPLTLLPGFRQPLAATPASVGLAFEEATLAAPTWEATLAAPTGEATRAGVDDAPALALPAWWMPHPAPRAALVLVHDGAANRSMLWTGEMDLVKRLHEAGYAVLTFDLRGHGEAPDAPNGTPTGRNVAPDVAAAVAFAHAQLPGAPVFLHGFGLGGVAAIYATAAGADVAAVSVDSVWADLAESLRHTIPDVTPVPAIAMAPSLYVAEHLYGIDFAGSRPRDAVGGLRVPLLAIVNAADRQVLPAHSEELAARAPRGSAWITPAPPPEHPIHRERGSWGTHSQSFALAPETYVARLVAFHDGALEAATY